MKMIFLFIDGFGLGEEDASQNPVYAANVPAIRHILRDFHIYPTDACLGVPGLPQSATGQTAIFTGVNASKVLGRHLNGQPTATLKKIIHENNLFKELMRMGFKATNANVYRQEYLDKMLDPKERRWRPSVTSVMTLSAGLRFRTVEDYRKGRGVYHDITGQIVRDHGYDVDVITPQEAAGRVFSISRDYDFTLFEHFMTDIIGHRQNMDSAIAEMQLLDAFLSGLLELVDLDEDILFLTSDHGNIENLSKKTHTDNRVPTVVMGKIPEDLELKIESLTDIMPCVLDIFRRQQEALHSPKIL